MTTMLPTSVTPAERLAQAGLDAMDLLGRGGATAVGAVLGPPVGAALGLHAQRRLREDARTVTARILAAAALPLTVALGAAIGAATGPLLGLLLEVSYSPAVV